MAYKRLNLADGTVLTANSLKHIEDGIVANEETAQKAAQTAASANGKAPAIFVDASGDIVTITDGAEGMPVQSLITHVVPVQEGEGDPSPNNIRNIIGWDAMSVTGNGKNFINVPEKTAISYGVTLTVQNNVVTMDGTTVIQVSNKIAIGKVVLKPGIYTLSHKILSGNVNGAPTDGTLIMLDQTQYRTRYNDPEVTFTVYAEKTFDVNIMYASKGAVYDNFTFSMQLEKNDAPTDFEHFNGQTLTAALPETLYGFDKNWTTGLVTVTHGVRVFTGDEAWQQQDATNTPSLFVIRDNALNGASSHEYTSDCSHFAWDNDLTKNNVHRLATNRNGAAAYIYVNAASHTTVDDFKAYLAAQYAAGTPVTVVYKLHVPYTIQLTPQQMETLKGTNNIWSNAGATEVTYVADTKMYADAKASTAMIGAAEPGMVATKNYSIGDFIIVGKSMYKATAAIATGEAITPGTNCTATTVVEQLAAIYNLLNA